MFKIALRLSLSTGHGVGRVKPVDPCGQVGDLDPYYQYLVNSRNLSQVGQVRHVNSYGQVRNTDPSGSK